MATKNLTFDEIFTNISVKNAKNSSFGNNAIYKTIQEFQNNDEISGFLKNDGITLNRSKLRKNFRNLLGCAVRYDAKSKKYIVTDKRNVLQFIKFCVSVYAVFNKNNWNNPENWNVSNLCKSNKEDNLQYIEKQVEIIKNYIKENF